MASFLPNLSRDNLSYYVVPAAWAVALSPHAYAAMLYQSKTKKSMDSRAPRGFVATVEADPALDSASKGRIQRAEAAQSNGFENIGLFAAAVVAGNVAKLDAAFLNGATLTYLISRVVYNYIYINNETTSLAAARTGTFFVGIGAIMSLFVQAGRKLQNSLL